MGKIATATAKDVPYQIIMPVQGLDEHSANVLATAAATTAKKAAPKMSGQGALGMRAAFGEGYFGVEWDADYMWFQERGIKAFTMTHVAGKVIPMWVEDPDGSLRRDIPAKDRAKRVKHSKDGRTLVLIFRKASHIGQRKIIDHPRRGRISVPRSYPGAPGRIKRRHAGRPDTPAGEVGGRIARSNVGVRWRHPGLLPRDFIANSIRQVGRDNGLTHRRLYAVSESGRIPL